MSNVLLGVTGGIAAYKSAYLARLLIKEGHSVRVMMTEEAEKFVGPLTFYAITGSAVMRAETGTSAISHIEWAYWADVCVVAPATANTIGKFACGIADSPFLSTLLAVTAPLVFAPAMNGRMLDNAAVRHNLSVLKDRGAYVIESREGELACGDTAKGRMEEPEIIAEKIREILKTSSASAVASGDANSNTECVSSLEKEPAEKALEGLKVLVTAGPTREFIDPVRYVSNRSSGRMGYAVAEAARDMGAEVTLISGETGLASPVKNTILTISAAHMAKAAKEASPNFDIIVMAAAVADYAPAERKKDKIKKTGDKLDITLVKTEDILSYLGENKKSGQILVGFAAETSDFLENALKKLKNKNADMIVLNDVSRKDCGFDSDFNDVKLLFKDGRISETGKRLKKDIARIILAEAAILKNS